MLNFLCEIKDMANPYTFGNDFGNEEGFSDKITELILLGIFENFCVDFDENLCDPNKFHL